MGKVRELIEMWSAKVLARAEEIKSIDASYKLILEGEEAGVWRLQCREPVSVSEGEGPAECTVSLSSQDFVAILEDKLNPQLAYLKGQLRVSGNIALALKLAQVF